MTTKLIISSLVGVVAIGGATVSGYYWLSKKETKNTQEIANTPNQQGQPVREEDTAVKKPLKELMDAGFVALKTDGDEDDTDWKTLITKYNTETIKQKRITVEGEIEKSSLDKDIENIKKLKKACETLLNKTDIVEDDKEMATNWCNKKSTLITVAS